MNIDNELWRNVARLVRDSPAAVLATADASGMPHATWMTPLLSDDLESVVGITLPETQKAANLRDNPLAEWTFFSPSHETFVYLSGPTEILSGEAARDAWDAMPGKTFAYYRNAAAGHSDDPADYAVIRTEVRKVVYTRPQGYRKTVVLDRDA